MKDLARRERQVVALLERWPWEHGGSLIGGYAVAAYGQPRYSHDLDLLIPVQSIGPFSKWLLKEGFEATILPDDLEQNYVGKIARWENDMVTLDLLVGGVMDRQAKIFIPESWLSQENRELSFTLLDSQIRKPVPVVRPEAFWALKLQAGRLKDLSDIFSMLDEPVELTQVRELYSELWCESMEQKLKMVFGKLMEPKTYRDVLSRLERGSPMLPRNKRDWQRFIRMIEQCLPVDPRSLNPTRP